MHRKLALITFLKWSPTTGDWAKFILNNTKTQVLILWPWSKGREDKWYDLDDARLIWKGLTIMGFTKWRREA